jgi:putative ABC transport system permease protein
MDRSHDPPHFVRLALLDGESPMNGWVVIQIALRALRRNKTRSLLTALGIIIGIAAVVAVVSVGEGATLMMKSQIASMGSNLVAIWPGASRTGGAHGAMGSMQSLTAEDAEAIGRECRDVEAVTPVIRSGAQVVYRENNWSTRVEGVGPDYPEVRDWPLASGAFFSESDVRAGARVCVLGGTVSENLFGGQDPVGKTIRIKSMTFRVVGLFERKGSTAWGTDQDDTVVTPWTTVRRAIESSPFSNVHQITISLHSPDHLDRAKEDISAVLRQRHRIGPGQDDDFTILDMTEVTQTITSVSTLMTVLLTIIASISLLVGGIGIMNIMLVSVTERTREIGLRMAVGARGRDILMQFLVEAVVLSGVGGLLGVGLGVFAARTVAHMNHWPVLISPQAIALALGVSAGVGIAFGFFPALRAARLHPIESLRYE